MSASRSRRARCSGYVGPNGAGKSTTVKMIIGLLEPTYGQMRFQGRSVIDDLPAFQSRIGYVPEEPHLYPHLSGREYLQLVRAAVRGMKRKVLEPKIDEFLQLFSLWDDQHTPLSAYSKGMRQKILLSAALLHNPEVLLILDEPLSGLDVTTALVLRDLVQGLAAQRAHHPLQLARARSGGEGLLAGADPVQGARGRARFDRDTCATRCTSPRWRASSPN